jgi:hypothetical protein
MKSAFDSQIKVGTKKQKKDQIAYLLGLEISFLSPVDTRRFPLPAYSSKSYPFPKPSPNTEYTWYLKCISIQRSRHGETKTIHRSGLRSILAASVDFAAISLLA